MAIAVTGVRERRVAGKRPSRSTLQPLLWIAPALLVLVAIFGYSIVTLFGQSMSFQGDWVGLENFALIFSDPLFTTGLLHNALLLLAVPVMAFLAMLVAVVLFETKKGLGFFRAVVFMPYILAVPVVAVVFGQLLQRNGPINEVLRSVGLGNIALDWLGDPHVALWTMAGVIMWKEVGFGVVLLLARMLTISTEAYEAAKLDGAGFWRTHWSITLPEIRPILGFYIVTEAITMVSWVFNYVYVLTNGQGGPGDSTVVSELYIYRNAFQYQQPELAAAAAVILFLGTMVFVVVFVRMQRRAMRANS
ncbi:sugar ABC transporter permease [Diaminobutyricibacter tongyongensis]|uniref:Sugar ABC transporter permease n=1 Tax=Leifsonia tongyongensis TaxID=1268043 RepID=A0A6L9XTK5_9MICO|nr:sugar ABC transporter permease [Diaminobutyricibacter tongyongensis]